tara:strand:- start:1661 stop:2302 length:642 start_codon:yes stop_codon:yes gene_type:complete
VEFKREERKKKEKIKNSLDLLGDNQEEVLDEIKNILSKNAQLRDELKNTKAKLDDKTKAFEDLVDVNQELHQTIINKSASGEKWAIQTVLLSTKFKLAMKTIQNKLIKNSAAAPENDIFDCPVCMEKQTIGIECDNKHKLCLNCSCSHLFTTNQSCPMCRDSYIKEDIRDIAKEAGVKFSNNPNSTSIGLEPIVAPIQFDGNVRRAIFERQQQ